MFSVRCPCDGIEVALETSPDAPRPWKGIGVGMKRCIAVIMEHADRVISPASYEAAAFGKHVQEIVGGPIVLVLLGAEVAELARALHASTGCRVSAVEVPGLVSYSGEVYREVLAATLSDLGAAYVCMANTTQGMDLAPGLAVRLRAACVTGVEAIEHDDEGLCFSRSMLGGKLVARVRARAEVRVLTVQSGAFRPHGRGDHIGIPTTDVPHEDGVKLRRVDCVPKRSRSLGIRESEPRDAALTEAKVIVAAGRGVGPRENLKLLRRLVAIFPSAALAASRPLCDLGWVEYRRQVGLTGAVVAPDLYIACGISGAVQHVLGMRDSGFVVAINTDPNAAIFSDADVGVVEDLSTFIPLLIEAWRDPQDGDSRPFKST